MDGGRLRGHGPMAGDARRRHLRVRSHRLGTAGRGHAHAAHAAARFVRRVRREIASRFYRKIVLLAMLAGSSVVSATANGASCLRRLDGRRPAYPMGSATTGRACSLRCGVNADGKVHESPSQEVQYKVGIRPQILCAYFWPMMLAPVGELLLDQVPPTGTPRNAQPEGRRPA